MKPVVIITIAVVCSVIGVFGYSFYEYDRIQGQIANIEQYQIDSITCEIFIMENGLPQGIGEYSQECLDFKSLPLQEQYEIVEKEKQQQYLDSDRPCGDNWDTSNCNLLRTNTENAFVVTQTQLDTLKYRDEVIVDKDFPWYKLQKGDMFIYNIYAIDNSPMRQTQFEQGQGYKVGRVTDFQYDYHSSPKTIKMIYFQHDQNASDKDNPNYDTYFHVYDGYKRADIFEKIYFGKVTDYIDTGIWVEHTKQTTECGKNKQCDLRYIERLCSTWTFNKIQEIESINSHKDKQILPDIEYDQMCIKKYTGMGQVLK